ncbi:DUF421 domain-containing protein [Neobacillus piezotolerans]|uniref:DUF421 domain-containing protein n=1 Tax=Neobacillus piezotolerans TaxID=2259171 RepID=A0A3D8GUX0_9BACI|nr:DUF421 domain-containing protein [Neobacillus piezotolerans]RDU38273.1 DUF421 domain-containing protein [Neobacillus piezotolerans]
MQLTDLIARLALSYFTLLVLMRITGRKEISQMTVFNFVSAISIGTIGASLAIDSSISIRNGLIALAAWTLFTVLTGFLDIKSRTARGIVTGEPIIVIKHGNIMEEALRKSRLDVDSLRALLRKKDVFSFSEVDYAIFEKDGTLSVLKKEGEHPLTKNALKQTTAAPKLIPMPTAVISDGQIIEENLRKYNLDLEWLDSELRSSGVSGLEDVFYAEIETDGTLYVDWRRDRPLH